MSDFLGRLLARVGRSLQPLLNPEADHWRHALADLRDRAREAGDSLKAQRDRLQQLGTTVHALDERTGRDLAAIRETLAKEAGRSADQLATQRSDLARLQKRVEELQRQDVADLRASTRDLRRALRQQVRSTGDLLSRLTPKHLVDEQRVARRLSRIARRGGPILVGPWTGEVGFELLYWAPFVRWFVEHHRVDPDRLHVVSRGGTGAWYGAGHYWDALQFLSADAFREATAALRKKQRSVQALDYRLLRAVRDAARLQRASVLHPAVMYRLFLPFWHGEQSFHSVLRYAALRRLVAPPVAGLPSLPGEFVAVRFYFSSAFPDTADNRRFVADTIRTLATCHRVVVLGSGVRLDDHPDAWQAHDPRVLVLDAGIDPARNLAVQSAVLARASHFVGTYGGFAYLAPLLGVDATVFYAVENFVTAHRDFAHETLRRIGGGRLTVIDVASAPFLGEVLRPREATRSVP